VLERGDAPGGAVRGAGALRAPGRERVSAVRRAAAVRGADRDRRLVGPGRRDRFVAAAGAADGGSGADDQGDAGRAEGRGAWEAGCEHELPAEAERVDGSGAAVRLHRAVAGLEGVLPAQGDRVGAAAVREEGSRRGEAVREEERGAAVGAEPARGAEEPLS